MDKAVICYDYIANGGTTTLGGDSRSPLMEEAARQRFFDILRDQHITDVYMKLRCDNVNRLTTYKDRTASFIKQATGFNIRVWMNVESPYWDFDGDGASDLLGKGAGIETWGPYLVKAASDYNLAVPAESRIYGVWFYVDYDTVDHKPHTSWNRSAALARLMKKADYSEMKFCYWLGWHDVSAGLSDLAANVDMFELDGYASTLQGMIDRLKGRADVIEAYGKPFRISLSCDFYPATPYTRYIKAGWPVVTQLDRMEYLTDYFNDALIPDVNDYFGERCDSYGGVGIQSYKWGLNVCYPLDFVYTPPPVDDTKEPDPVTMASLKTDIEEQKRETTDLIVRVRALETAMASHPNALDLQDMIMDLQAKFKAVKEVL